MQRLNISANFGISSLPSDKCSAETLERERERQSEREREEEDILYLPV
jgi:hypothetical protein